MHQYIAQRKKQSISVQTPVHHQRAQGQATQYTQPNHTGTRIPSQPIRFRRQRSQLRTSLYQKQFYLNVQFDTIIIKSNVIDRTDDANVHTSHSSELTKPSPIRACSTPSAPNP